VIVLHGAGSRKESHHDFARALVAADLAALLFDQRGHGESAGPMDGRVLDDVAVMASVLRSRCGVSDLPIALRGSSMGGCLAIWAASSVGARAVVAICPADPAGLRAGLRSGQFDADVESLDEMLSHLDLHVAVEELSAPLLLIHAAGDEQVPVEFSRELSRHFRVEQSRLIVVPGGHHRSVQHDSELQAVSAKFIVRALAGRFVEH
jgi:alpha-beta hydrolase superfamily lysophospholipase